jgi:hypothetical protein
MPELGHFSSIGTKSAVESPSAERPAANPAQICDVLSNFGSADSWSTRFLSENFPELTAAGRGVSRTSRIPDLPAKHPHALPKRDSGIDGTMRRPVATVEARRSRSPNVADDVALKESRYGKEGGAQSLVGTIRGILCGFPSAIFSHKSTNRLVIPTSQPWEPSAILATNSATKEIEDGSPLWLFINGLMNCSSSPAVRTIRIRGSVNHC